MAHTRIVNLDGELYECDDYRDRLQSFAPELISIIERDSKEDLEIQKAFLKRFNAMDRAINDNGYFEAEPCFFDVLFRAEEGNQNDKHLLFFLNNCFKQINASLCSSLVTKYRTMMYNLVCNFDDEKSRLYSGIAEIATLCKILDRKELSLKDIEQKMPNGKSVDFVIKYDGKDYFIEVVSILYSVDKIKSADDCYVFLHRRVDRKFTEKYQNLANSYLGRISLLPILWGDLYNLKQYWEALLRIDKAYRGPLFPFYCLFHAGEKGYVFVPANDVFQYAEDPTCL